MAAPVYTATSDASTLPLSRSFPRAIDCLHPHWTVILKGGKHDKAHHLLVPLANLKRDFNKPPEPPKDSATLQAGIMQSSPFADALTPIDMPNGDPPVPAIGLLASLIPVVDEQVFDSAS